jgi:UDP-N-acetylglucosamine 2-epimerase (hydrolysing)
MDVVLAKTIYGLSDFVKEYPQDLIIVHGDRVEALAGAMVGALNNILVGHIEGGEVSGTIDEMIRHSISKVSHLHFVSNHESKRRLRQLGEGDDRIFVIGSPDLDVMCSDTLPSIDEVKKHYDIPFSSYYIFVYHPVTTEIERIKENIDSILDGLIDSGENFVVIYPNNDSGSNYIIDSLSRLKENERFRVIPSIRFEYFLVAIKNATAIVGNSSAGVREAPFYGVPSINIGTRQNNRSKSKSIINIDDGDKQQLLSALSLVKQMKCLKSQEFGDGNSTRRFVEVLCSEKIWKVSPQKYFVDINID